MGIPPFISPAASVHATSSAHRLLPGSNALDIYHPALPWLSQGVTAQTIDIDLGLNYTNPALALSWLNFPELNIWQSQDAAIWRLRTPNLIRGSHQPSDVSVWGLVNATAAPTAFPGPSLHLPNAELVTFTTSSGVILQVVDMMGESIAGTPALITFWARKGTATSLWIGESPTLTTIQLNANWTKYTIPITTVDPNSIALWVQATMAGTFYWGGLQLTFNTTQAPLTTYQTGSNGLVAPINTQNGRRAVYIDTKGFFGRYLRIAIPANQPRDDSASGYSIGSAAPVVAPAQFHGEQSHPKHLVIATPIQETTFESQNTEVAILGRTRVTPSFQSALVAFNMQETLFRIARMTPGNAFVYFENDREPQGFNDLPNPARVYIAKLTAQTQFNYPIPELVEVGFDFQEIT